MTPPRRELLFDLDAEAAHRGAQPPPVQGVAVVGPSGAETAALHDGLHARGLAVPQALGVVGFGDQDIAADLHPALTTVRVDGTHIGQLAADCIIDRALHETHHGRAVDVGFQVMDRGSA